MSQLVEQSRSSKFQQRVRRDGVLSAAAWAARSATVQTYNRLREKAILGYWRTRARDGEVNARIQGSLMHLRVDDPGISRELLLTGFHEERTTALVRREVTRGMTVVEVGANLGYYSLIEASLIGPTGRIHAFEPVPRNFHLLNRNIRLNGYDSIIQTYNLAVSDKAGIAQFTVTDASNWGTMIDVHEEDKSEYIKERMRDLARQEIDVQAVTLDGFLAEIGNPHVNFIRMDIEGFEIAVLRGMRETLRRCPSPVKLLIEVHNSVFKDPEAVLAPTFGPLLEMGFRPRRLIAKKDDLEDMTPETFMKVLCAYRTGVCHVLLVK